MTTFSDTYSTQLPVQSVFDKNEGKEQDFEDVFQTRLRSFRRQDGSFWRSPLSPTASIEPLFPNSSSNNIARGDTIGSRDPSWRWRAQLSVMERANSREDDGLASCSHTSTTCTSLSPNNAPTAPTALPVLRKEDEVSKRHASDLSDRHSDKMQGSSVNAHNGQVKALIDRCEAVRFPFRKRLLLNNLQLSSHDLIKNLPLGISLHTLSLSGNPLLSIPDDLVRTLPLLKQLDVSHCRLAELPQTWCLPQLRLLDLSNNRIADFPSEAMLNGILALEELNMYGNDVSELIIPCNPKVFNRLVTLNIGCNDLAYLPEDLVRLTSLRVLLVMQNSIDHIPMRICQMRLRTLNVSDNPMVHPPLEICKRGVSSMKHYYRCLLLEERHYYKHQQTKQKQRFLFVLNNNMRTPTAPSTWSYNTSHTLASTS